MPARTARVINATWGDPHRGCNRPSAGGGALVNPATNGMRDDGLDIQDDELAIGKQVEVMQIMSGLEAFGIIERRKTDALQRCEPWRMLGPGLQDDQPVLEFAVIRHAREPAC